MFGIANQLLAVMALALVTTVLVNSGKGRYAPITLLPMLFVTTTTLTAGKIMIFKQLEDLGKNIEPVKNAVNMGLTLFVILSVCMLVLIAVARWLAVWLGGNQRRGATS